MLDYQVVSVNLGKGVDTKTDRKLVAPSKIIDLRDANFDQGGDICKRNGYDSLPLSIIGGGSISNPKLIKSYASRLICTDGSNLYDYSQNLSAWRNAGPCDSISLSEINVSGSTQNQRNSNNIVFGNYAITAYESWTSFSNPYNTGILNSAVTVNCFLTVLDLLNDTIIKKDIPLRLAGAGTIFMPRVVTLAGTQPAVLYVDGVTGFLYLRTITISAGGVVIGSEQTIITDFKAYTGDTDPIKSNEYVSYDLVQTSTGCSLAYSSSAAGNPIKFIKLNTSGAITATGSIAAVGLAIPISITQDPTNFNLWVYWSVPASATLTNSNNQTIKYAIVSSTFSSVLIATVIETGIDYPRQITSLVVSTTQQTAYYSSVPFIQGSAGTTNTFGGNTDTMFKPSIRTASVDSSGTVGPKTILLSNLDIFSKPFTINSKNYLACVFPSSQQFSGFLIDLFDGHVAGKFLRGTAESSFDPLVGVGVGLEWFRTPGFLSIPYVYGSKFIFSSGKVSQEINNQITPSATYQVYYDDFQPKFQMGTSLVVFDFNNKESNQAILTNNVMVLNGSIISQYDGNSVTELGFNNYPEFNAAVHTTGGSLADGSYSYQVVYQWIDGQGNLHQSSDSILYGYQLTGGGGNGSITLTIKNLSFSQKNSQFFISNNVNSNEVQILVYGTEVNGITPFLFAQLTNSTSGPTITVTDVGNRLLSQPIYTNNGAIVSNSALPSSDLMWINNNRLWMVDSENPSTDVWYSKTLANFTGISMSDVFVYEADPRLGNIKAGIAMDEKTLLLKENGILYFIGDGASDSGQGSSLTLSQIIPSDVGCSGSKGVILIPMGVIFRAADNKGIFMVTRGTQVQYFGVDVASVNSQDITASEMIGNKTQVRFLTGSGLSLVYDYYYNQWGYFTNHTGLSSTIWNGVYTYVRADGLIYTENPTSFLDGSSSYSLYAKLAWLKAAQVQNFQRIRLAEILGDYLIGGSHGLQTSYAYDFDDSTLVSTSPFSFASSSGTLEFRSFLPRQKCDSVQIIIQELVTGASGEYVQLSDLGLEVGLKKGLNKMSAGQSVG